MEPVLERAGAGRFAQKCVDDKWSFSGLMGLWEGYPWDADTLTAAEAEVAAAFVDECVRGFLPEISNDFWNWF